MKSWVSNIILLTSLALSPGLIHAQQVSKPVPQFLIKADTVKQNTTLKQGNAKPILGKYDYYNSLGVACKAELKLEKATKIPFRFRLGSLQQTDYMERKPNAQKPQ
ncbi:MAG: hypothetical protein WC756_07260 [Taibaiella sp.]|jgi:hypothetical protein